MINYDNFSILTALAIGLIGNFHCIGMCSGIITVFSMSVSKDKKKYSSFYIIYYNLGRIIGYMFINTVAFSIGLILIKSLNIDNLNFLKLISGLTLLTIGCYLLNILNLIKHIEKLGFKIWNHIQKYIKFFFPVNNPLKAILLGFIWSHIPCGLVYSTVIWSTSSGSFLKSILLVLIFGIGTLPSMLGVGLFSFKLKEIVNYNIIKYIFSLLFLISGTYNIYIYFAIKSCH